MTPRWEAPSPASLESASGLREGLEKARDSLPSRRAVERIVWYAAQYAENPEGKKILQKHIRECLSVMKAKSGAPETQSVAILEIVYATLADTSADASSRIDDDLRAQLVADPAILGGIPVSLFADEVGKSVLDAVGIATLYENLPESLRKKSPDIALSAIHGLARNWQHTPNALKSKPGFLEAAFAQNRHILKYLDAHERTPLPESIRTRVAEDAIRFPAVVAAFPPDMAADFFLAYHDRLDERHLRALDPEACIAVAEMVFSSGITRIGWERIGRHIVKYVPAEFFADPEKTAYYFSQTEKFSGLAESNPVSSLWHAIPYEKWHDYIYLYTFLRSSHTREQSVPSDIIPFDVIDNPSRADALRSTGKLIDRPTSEGRQALGNIRSVADLEGQFDTVTAHLSQSPYDIALLWKNILRDIPTVVRLVEAVPDSVRFLSSELRTHASVRDALLAHSQARDFIADISIAKGEMSFEAMRDMLEKYPEMSRNPEVLAYFETQVYDAAISPEDRNIWRTLYENVYHDHIALHRGIRSAIAESDHGVEGLRAFFDLDETDTAQRKKLAGICEKFGISEATRTLLIEHHEEFSACLDATVFSGVKLSNVYAPFRELMAKIPEEQRESVVTELIVVLQRLRRAKADRDTQAHAGAIEMYSDELSEEWRALLGVPQTDADSEKPFEISAASRRAFVSEWRWYIAKNDVKQANGETAQDYVLRTAQAFLDANGVKNPELRKALIQLIVIEAALQTAEANDRHVAAYMMGTIDSEALDAISRRTMDATVWVETAVISQSYKFTPYDEYRPERASPDTRYLVRMDGPIATVREQASGLELDIPLPDDEADRERAIRNTVDTLAFFESGGFGFFGADLHNVLRVISEGYPGDAITPENGLSERERVILLGSLFRVFGIQLPVPATLDQLETRLWYLNFQTDHEHTRDGQGDREGMARHASQKVPDLFYADNTFNFPAFETRMRKTFDSEGKPV